MEPHQHITATKILKYTRDTYIQTQNKGIKTVKLTEDEFRCLRLYVNSIANKIIVTDDSDNIEYRDSNCHVKFLHPTALI